MKHYFNEDNVLVIDIKMGNNKPYYLSSTGPRPNGTYIRVGRSKRQATDGEIISMIRDYSNSNWEEETSMNQDLHFKFAKTYFESMDFEFNEEKYFPIGIRNNDSKFTNLGLLLSDENPIVVKMACYDNFLDFKFKREFTGSILQIVRNVLTQAEMFNITSAVIPEIGGIREETKSFPGKSLREAILNALCHADYSEPSNIKIEFYKERVEITSPGGIYRRSLDDILKGVQSFRNPKLVAILHKLGFIENYGSGLKRIKEAYPEHDIKEFIIHKELWFRIILPDLNFGKNAIGDNVHNNVHNNGNQNVHNNGNQKINNDSSKLVRHYEKTNNAILNEITNLIKTNPKINQEEIANKIGKSKRSIHRIIKNAGIFRFVGHAKGGYWEVLENSATINDSNDNET